MPSLDLAVLAQDPRFGGGFRSQAEAFWRGATELGRQPHLLYLSRAEACSVARRSLALRPRVEEQGPLAGTAWPSLLPELDLLNQLAGARRLARAAREAQSLWVVAAAASHGAAALRAGRPYGCWIGTALEREWASRRAGLPRSRRLALRLNAPVLRRLERAVLRRASVLCATSPASRRGLAEAAGIPAGRIRVLPIPVDAARFRPADHPPDPERPLVLFAGRADDPRKNAGLLLRAFPAIRERTPGARLRLVGSPPGPELCGLVGSGIEVAGHVPDVAAELRQASLFVLPSRQEGFGIVVAEALAAGVPALVTPSGGPEELVRESGGGVVLAGFDAGELAREATGLLQDPSRLRELGALGRAHVVREHSPERFRSLLAEALAEVDGRA